MSRSIKKEMMKNDPSCASTPEDIMKWEIAKELGVYDKVLSGGWKCLSAKESGRIGGILNSRKKKLMNSSGSSDS